MPTNEKPKAMEALEALRVQEEKVYTKGEEVGLAMAAIQASVPSGVAQLAGEDLIWFGMGHLGFWETLS